MAQAVIPKEQFWIGLEQLGEKEVRDKLAMGEYGDVGQRRGLVELWLFRWDQERFAARDASILSISEEQLRIARRTYIIAIVTLIAAIATLIAAIASIVTAAAFR